MRQAVHLLLCLVAIFLPAAASDVPGTFDPDAHAGLTLTRPRQMSGRRPEQVPMEPVVAKQAKPAASSTAIAAVQATSAVSATNIAAQDASAETGEAVSFQLTTFTTNNCLPPVSSITSSFDGYNATCLNIEYSKDLSINTRGRGTCHGHYLKFLYYDSIGCIGKQVGSGFGIRDQCTPLPNRGYAYQSIWVRCSSPPLEQHCVFLDGSTGEGDECNSKPAKSHDDDGYEGVYVIGEIPMASSTENASTATSSDFSTTTETDTGADTSASSSGEQLNDAEENKESSATCSSTSRAIIFAMAIFSIV